MPKWVFGSSVVCVRLRRVELQRATNVLEMFAENEEDIQYLPHLRKDEQAISAQLQMSQQHVQCLQLTAAPLYKALVQDGNLHSHGMELKHGAHLVGHPVKFMSISLIKFFFLHSFTLLSHFSLIPHSRHTQSHNYLLTINNAHHVSLHDANDRAIC